MQINRGLPLRASFPEDARKKVSGGQHFGLEGPPCPARKTMAAAKYDWRPSQEEGGEGEGFHALLYLTLKKNSDSLPLSFDCSYTRQLNNGSSNSFCFVSSSPAFD